MTPLFEVLGYVALGVGCLLIGALTLVCVALGMISAIGYKGDAYELED